MVRIYYKNHSKKLITISFFNDIVPLRAKLTIKPKVAIIVIASKQKCGQPAKIIIKYAQKSWVSKFCTFTEIKLFLTSLFDFFSQFSQLIPQSVILFYYSMRLKSFLLTFYELYSDSFSP